MDDMDFGKLKAAVDNAIAGGQWLVLAGHDIGDTPGRAGTRVSMLRELLAYFAGAVTPRLAGHVSGSTTEEGDRALGGTPCMAESRMRHEDAAERGCGC